MKKNKFLKLASILMMACLMTTCVISGTFAKYVSTTSASDKARVAKWGFKEASITIDDLFDAVYDTNKVVATTDVIAPGTTSSTTIKFQFDAGTSGVTAPEVAYSFKVDASESAIAAEIENNANIQWALVEGDSSPAEDSSEWSTWDALINEINGLTDMEVEANTLPDLSADYTIAWRWVFHKDTAGDTADTDMSESLAEVEVKITITATQID